MTGQMLAIWTVYRGGYSFCARKWLIVPNADPQPTQETLIGSLEMLQEQFQNAGLVKMLPSPEDDPSIVESWL